MFQTWPYWSISSVCITSSMEFGSLMLSRERFALALTIVV
jgi:hypothetical protein